jgi:hypothetical protein
MGVAGTSKIDPNSNKAKEYWRDMYRDYGGTNPTKEEFYDKWGEYP